MSGVTVRPERSVAGHFSVPVAETGAVLLVRPRILEGEDPSKWTTATLDRRGVRLAVNAGGHLERVARATFSQAHIRVIRSNDRVRQALERGQVDAVVTDTVEAPLWRQGLEDVVLVGPFTRDRKAYLLPAHEMALAGRIDAWLLARERDGTLAELRSQWLG